MKTPSIRQAIEKYLDVVHLSRSKNTVDTYLFATRAFQQSLVARKVDLDAPVSSLTEEGISWLAEDLKELSPATEAVYLQAVRGFYKFLAAEQLASINLPRLDLLKQQRARRLGVRLPQFPASEIDRLLHFVSAKEFVAVGEPAQQLRALRDRAFILSLADSGLRVHEACKLQRGQIDWNEGRAVVIGKGNKQAVVRFSKRSIRALKAYLAARAPVDGSTGKALTALPSLRGMTTAQARRPKR